MSNKPPTVSLRRVRLNAGGYDRRGQYFGIGAPLYRACGETEGGADVDTYTRAWSREDARDQILAQYASARIRR